MGSLVEIEKKKKVKRRWKRTHQKRERRVDKEMKEKNCRKELDWDVFIYFFIYFNNLFPSNTTLCFLLFILGSGEVELLEMVVEMHSLEMERKRQILIGQGIKREEL